MERVLALVLAACGGASHASLDAGEPGPVTVTVTNDSPMANVEVYFQDVDSTVIATAQTDANGTATQIMEAGGFVTLVDPGVSGAMPALVTWAGVKPGDHLVFGNATSAYVPVTFTLPVDTRHGTIHRYQLWISCDNTLRSVDPGTAIFTDALAGCGGAADITDVAVDADNQPVGFFYVPGQPVADGATIDFSGEAFAATVPRNVELDNNASHEALSISDQFLTSRGQVFGGGVNSTNGETVTTMMSEPVMPDGGLDVLRTAQTVGTTTRFTSTWGPTNADYAVDYPTTLLGDFATVPAFEPTTRDLTWTTGQAAKPAQFSVGVIVASRGNFAWAWTIIGPGGTNLEFPTVPTDVADFNTTDAVIVEEAAIGNMPGGYDAYRERAYVNEVPGPPDPIGAAGTAAYNDYRPSETAVRHR